MREDRSAFAEPSRKNGKQREQGEQAESERADTPKRKPIKAIAQNGRAYREPVTISDRLRLPSKVHDDETVVLP